jgi:LytS/YehU family sensor histidine kinase
LLCCFVCSAQHESASENVVDRVAIFSLLPFLVAFFFIFFIFYRQKREATLRQQRTELEIRALRAQMNPHFIFNSLNSIYLFIQQNQSKQAAEYLLDFSKLIRRVLENSIDDVVTLSEDLETLQWYVKLEQLRTDNRFSYQVKIDPQINPDEIVVPPLILQPFVENSIWHGMAGINDQSGKIELRVYSESGMLKMELSDNGSGEHFSEKEDSGIFDTKKKSLGTSIVHDRLEIISKKSEAKAFFTIRNINNDKNVKQGTIVELSLPLLKD